ncbi:MAG: mechanosensitive ion channel family protein [Spirochaetales bacterium]|nr:mechanosensitive ion channel family protein [Spirochaetales bacterium]
MTSFLNSVLIFLSIYGGRIGLAILIILLSSTISHFVTPIVLRVFKKRSLDPGLGGFLGSLLRTGILILGWISALITLGIQSNSFVAVVGALGLALSLSLKDSLSNLASGVMTLFFHPFIVGDFIESGSYAGTVVEISMMYTSLDTVDNRRVIIPNSVLNGATIVNYSINPTRRKDLVFAIGYSGNIERAKEVALEALGSDERVLTNPEPMVGVLSLGKGTVDLLVRYHCKNEDLFPTELSLNEKIKQVFTREGI